MSNEKIANDSLTTETAAEEVTEAVETPAEETAEAKAVEETENTEPETAENEAAEPEEEDDFSPIPEKEPEAAAEEAAAEPAEDTAAAAEESGEDAEEKPPKERWAFVKKAAAGFKKAVTSKKFIVTVSITAGVLAAVYVGGAAYYHNHFFFGSIIRGYKCGNMTVEETEKKIRDAIGRYQFTLYEHDDAQEVIKGSEVELTLNEIGSIAEQKAKQNPWLWCFDFDTRVLDLDINVSLNEELLNQKVDALNVLQESNNSIGDAVSKIYFGGAEYYIESDGSKNHIDGALLHEKVKVGMYGVYPDMNLEEEGCYVGIANENHVKALLEQLDKMVGTKVTYTNGDDSYVLDAATIQEWITINDDFTINLDYTSVANWVAELAQNYDSVGSARPFVTTNGDSITVEGGTYGWNVNNEEETEELYQILMNGESTTREPVYKQTAATHGAVDFGNTYVEISISNQHLWFYKDGEIIVSTDLVSGNPNAGNSTGKGVYYLVYKDRDAVLKGPGYESPVSFWMPFNGGQGLHDAPWRGSFGGSIYRGGGSHGCVNLPYSAASAIFDAIEPGDPIIVY